MIVLPPGVRLDAPHVARAAEVLTPDAVALLVLLQRSFNRRRLELLEARVARQARLDAGERLDFLAETKAVREASWRVAPLPADLKDRRVEITGPVDRKMIINALNSGAKVFMADFEDSTTPTWENLIDGQGNLCDAVKGTIAFEDAATGRSYKLGDSQAVLFVRVRGWHLEERHLLVDGEAMAASLFDFGLYLLHNAERLLARASGPYFYLPKLESHLEARLWRDVFAAAEQALGLRAGSIRATVLIETITAAFEMDEILYELRDYSAGLNCGRWDYIFSFIKKFAGDAEMRLPDRSQITMESHFLRSYSRLAIQTCHRRGVSAMGGMSAFIPIRSDAEANERALAQVRIDKEREVRDGHDGTWVAHPGLVPVVLEVFDRVMPQANQIDKRLEDLRVTADDLLAAPQGAITEAGLRLNVAVGLGYVEAWLRGIGCVPLFNLMEDAATAEISRAQLWQWVHHGARLADGRAVTMAMVEAAIKEELARARVSHDAPRYGAYEQAASLMRGLVTTPKFGDFLTLPAYDQIVLEGL